MKPPKSRHSNTWDFDQVAEEYEKDKMMFKNMPKYFWLRFVYWKLMPSVDVTVKWPEKYAWENSIVGDPNLHIRPWLEMHVGKQGYKWDWTLNWSTYETITITLPFYKKKYATMIKLMWG